MLHVACCLWDVNERSRWFSKCYDESWAEKLYRGFRRNLTDPFRFVVFTDRQRVFRETAIEQERLAASTPDYGCLIEPFRLNEPTIICGLDMVVVRNIDHMARYCLTGEKIAAPWHPSRDDLGYINPVVFVPKGHRAVYDDWRGENDIKWINARAARGEMVRADQMWPGEILSLKLHAVPHGSQPPPLARIIYMHGRSKPHELGHCGWIKQHWV